MKQSFSLKEIASRISSLSDEDISEEELFAVIQKVSEFHKNKIFAYYDTDDIQHEVWLICLNQLQHYEPSKGKGHDIHNSVERWLNKVVKNRLANLYRDKYSSVNDQYRQNRMNIINSLPFDVIDTSRESKGWGYTENNHAPLVFEEFREFIESRLTPELMSIYEDCMNQDNVTPYYRTKLRTALIPILDEWNELHKTKGELDGY